MYNYYNKQKSENILNKLRLTQNFIFIASFTLIVIFAVFFSFNKVRTAKTKANNTFNNSVPTQNNSWKSYSNEFLGITFELPVEGVVSDERCASGDNCSIVIQDSIDVLQENTCNGCYFINIDKVKDVNNWNDIKKHIIENKIMHFDDPNIGIVFKKKDLLLDNHTAWFVEIYEASLNDQNSDLIFQLEMVIIDPDNPLPLIIGNERPQAIFEQKINYFPHFLSTLKFIDKTKSIILPVRVLPTEYSIENANRTITHPDTIQINVAKAFSDKVQAFGISDRIVIAPKGYTGKGYITPDANVYINIYPSQTDNPDNSIVTATEIPGCVSCALEAASIYFSDAENKYRTNYSTPPNKPKGLVVTKLDNKLIKFSVTNDSGTTDKIGAAYYSNIDGQPYFLKIEIRIGTIDYDFADELRNIFIRQNHLKS